MTENSCRQIRKIMTGDKPFRIIRQLSWNIFHDETGYLTMSEDNRKHLPKNPTEAQGLLMKAIYERFGEEALPVIRDVCGRQGCSLGLRIKAKLSDNRLSTVAAAFAKSFNPDAVEVISVSDEKFHIRGKGCPFGLENTSRELCEAVMNIDLEYFRTAVSEKIDLKIEKTVADGDVCCDTIYTLSEI